MKLIYYELTLIILFIIVSCQDILLKENGISGRCLLITSSSFFCVTNTTSFLYTLDDMKPTHNHTFNFTISNQSSLIFALEYNSGKGRISLYIDSHILVYDSLGDLQAQEEYNDASFAINHLYSIFHLDNGNIIVSNANDKVIYHVVFKSASYVRSKEITMQNTIEGNIQCHTTSLADYFFCFHIYSTYPRTLVATYFEESSLNAGDSYTIEIPEIQALKSCKINDSTFLICLSTFATAGICTFFYANTNSFSASKEIYPNYTIFDAPISFEVGVVRDDFYAFVAIRSWDIHFVHFNSQLELAGNDITYPINNGAYSSAISYMLLGNFETIAYDCSSDTNLYLHYLGSGYCLDLCYEKAIIDSSINLNISDYIKAYLQFKKISTDNGDLSSEGGFLDDFNVFDSQTINLVYTSTKSSPYIDTFTYYGISQIDNSIINECTITIYNGNAGYCPCVNSSNDSILYHYNSQCIAACPNTTYQDEDNLLCVNCKDNNQYFYQSQCIDYDDIPSSSFISDDLFNIVLDCKSPCATCETTEDYCLTCIDDYRISPLQPNICIKDNKETIVEIPTNDTLDDFVDDINNTLSNYTEQITIIEGDGYRVEITNSSLPNGNLQLSKIDFSPCEKALRKHYGYPLTEQFIFVKIDIDRNTLTDQVEYAVYNSKGVQLDMSICKDEKITITYTIKNTSAINSSMAEYYANYGIDIFDAEDPFFNDICYPFTTEDNTDITLADRRKDIYQNLSLCESKCDYDSIDLENYTVTCTCSVKEELNTKITFDFFENSFLSVFTDSNYEVIKCYNLIFNSSIIWINIGFWMFLTFSMLHIPFFVYYCVNGLSPIRHHMHHLKGVPPKRQNKDYIDRIIHDGSDYNEDEEIREYRRQSRMNTGMREGDSNPFYRKLKEMEKDIEEEKEKKKLSLSPNKRSMFNNRHSIKANLELFHLNNVNNDMIIIEDVDNEGEVTLPYKRSILKNDLPSLPQEREINILPTQNDNNNSILNAIPSRNNSMINDSDNYRPIVHSRKFLTRNVPSLKHSDSSPSIDSRSNTSIIGFHRTNKRTNSVRTTSTKVTNYLNKGKNENEKIMSTEKEDTLDKITIYSKEPLQSQTTLSTEQKLLKPSRLNTLSNSSLPPINEKPSTKPSKHYLDDFDLENAIKYDTRSFCRCYYLSLLTKQSVLSTFVYKSPFELKVVRIIMFIFGNAMDFAFNAFFYLESMISERYNYTGNLGILFDLQNTIFSTLASTLVSMILTSLLNCLSTSKEKLEALKALKQQDHKLYHKNLKKIITILKVKLFFFIVIEYLLMLFFWYYVSCFCAVYQGSQMSWLQGGITSFIFGMILPFATSFAIALMRHIAVKKKYSKLFKFSIWLYRL